MIGYGLKKLAATHNMHVDKGVAYGTLGGYATTMSEGAGYKLIQFTTTFQEEHQPFQLQNELNKRDLNKDFRVQDIAVLKNCISIVFYDNPGTMKKITAFIEYFLPLLESYGASKSNICTECGCEIESGQWKLINGTAYYFHQGCAQKVQSFLEQSVEIQKSEDKGSYASGFLGAFLGASLGAVLWALIYYWGYVASLVGFAIGWLAEKGYNLLHGKQRKGKIIILLLSIVLGVILGTILGHAFTFIGMIQRGELYDLTYSDIPWMFIMLLEDSEYVTAFISDFLIGLLFAALGIFSLLQRANNEVANTKITDLK